MNRDDIIRMAREAKLAVQEPSWGYSESYHFAGFEEYFLHFAALVAAAEREACVDICDDYDVAEDVNRCDTAEGIALAIRARGNDAT